MNNLKLGVDVVSAHNLMPKDGQGSSSAYVELYFDGQRYRTTVKEKDLNPVWNESFYFNISDPSILHHLSLDAYIYNNVRGTNTRTFLGKATLSGTSFVPHSDAVVLHYPLEKRGIFSRVRGEIGLKVYITDDPSIRSSIPVPITTDTIHESSGGGTGGGGRSHQVRHTFHHLPNPNPNNHEPVSNPNPHDHPSVNDPREGSLHSNSYQVEQLRAEAMKADAPAPRIIRTHSISSASQPIDYALKETSPYLGGGRVIGGRVVRPDKTASTYDLVERMQFLYVRVVKARELPAMDITGSLDPFVEVRIGNYKGVTKHIDKQQNPEWNVVFAFSKDRMQASVLEVVLKDKDLMKDDFVGLVRFDLNEVPTRVPPDSPLAPQWYRLEDKKRERIKGEVMLAVWIGTQADEAFSDAWHSDAAIPMDSSTTIAQLRSKVYQAPRLWYVRVNVIEAQDLIPSDKTRFPEVYVKAQIGHQVMKTRSVQGRNLNSLWNEDLLFVAAEPFEDHLILNVEDRVAPGRDEILGRVVIPLSYVDRRADDRLIPSKWFNLDKPIAVDVDQIKKDKFSSRIHLRVCLDGGYHVLDESTNYSSDLRPTAKQLWKTSVGVLELGILNADGLHPMKSREGRGTCDTYCVAKYGHKWVRTRTIVDCLFPKYNEQYTWEVFDPATVLTVGVFDNCQIGDSKGANANKDVKIGKVRIRISTLETGRIYTHTYPLLVLHPTGVKKMGELHLALRFTSTSFANMLYQYTRPLLPKMHYVRPFTVLQQDMLRHQAVTIVAMRLGRAEPPLRREIVEYMSDVHSHLWSMRRSKANFFRLMSIFSGPLAVIKWFGDVCMWKNPITTVLVHILFLMLVCFPELILPTCFLYMFLIGIWNYRYRPRYPPHMNIKISQADRVNPDELDEEFDTFPTSRSPELVRMRYDRLRSVAGRIQTVIGDIATQGERFQALLSWRDPRATAVFVVFCLLAAVVMYVTPFQVVAALGGCYMMRHPRFRYRLPALPVNFFRRLPARTDSML